MNFPDHFSRVAADYSSFRPSYNPLLIERLAAMASRRRCAWDVATGSGQVARLLAGHFERVVATDASAAQLRFAGPHPRVTYRVETAERPSLAPASVDLITVAAGMHWLREDAFYRAVRRVAAPGAVLAMFSYGTEITDEEHLKPVIDAYHRDVLGPWWPPQYRIIQGRYRSLRPPFQEHVWPGSVAHCTADFDGLLGLLRTWSGASIMARETGTDPTAAIASALREAWEKDAPIHETRRLCWPVFGRVVRVV